MSPVDDLGSKDAKRQRRVAGGTICQVCGLKLTTRAYCALNIDPGQPRYPVGSRLPEDTGVHAMDHGLLHARCLRLALAHCPELQRLDRAGELVLCEVPPGSVEAFGEDVRITDRSMLAELPRQPPETPTSPERHADARLRASGRLWRASPSRRRGR